MKKIFGKITYRHHVVYNDVEYIRTEVMEDDSHIIKWELRLEVVDPVVEYFSSPLGWSKNDILCKSNPIPEIEKCFKETIGKDLLY
jgi:hypothetical protein